MSEAMAHLLLVLAQHPAAQDALAADPADERYFSNVLNETLRLYPLFGVAHRISTDDIPLGEDSVLPAGSVLCFNYPEYHATGYSDPETFDPGRWDRIAAREAHHIPFGVAANRPCPAWRLAPLAMRAATREVLERFTLDSPVSHTRSIPHRAPCLLIRRDRPLTRPRLTAVRTFLRLRDRWEDVGRGWAQLFLGAWMVLDARRVRPAERYFAAHDTEGRPLAGAAASGAPTPEPPASCPYGGRAS